MTVEDPKSPFLLTYRTEISITDIVTADFETGESRTEEKIAFGKFVSAKRKAKGLTQGELAQRLYVTESAVSKWERGISYPDITLVTAICSALEISEHELITASDDVHQRQVELQAEKYRRLRNAYLWTWNVIYGMTILACLICNLAITHALTWFFIVAASCIMAYSLTNLPLLVEKRKRLATLGAFFLSLNLLLLVCCIYTSGRWFLVSFASLAFAFSVVFAPFVLRDVVLPEKFCAHKALISFGADTLLLFLLLTVVCAYQNQLSQLFYPVWVLTLYLLTLPWAFLLVIRYIKINAWFRTSVCLVVSGLYILTVNGVSDFITDRRPFALPPTNLGDWSLPYMNGNIVSVITLACLTAAVLFTCGGIRASARRRSPQEGTGRTK